MSYKTILLHLQLGHSHAALLHLTARMGDRFGARLVGVAASRPRRTRIADGGAKDVRTVDELDERRAMALAERAFHAALGLRSPSVSWQSRPNCRSIAAYVAEVARGADLILTDSARGWHVDTQRQLQTAELLMRAGRPVLIAPAAAGPLLFAHALVAWDDSRECRRAMTDALPLLRNAERVSVVQVAPGDEHEAAFEQLHAVVAWLRSHGVGAQALMLPTPAGPPLLGTLALDQACDMIVAGAYGQSRLLTRAPGEVTCALVAQRQVAVMLSH